MKTFKKLKCMIFHVFHHKLVGGYLHETEDGKKWVFTCKKCGRRWNA